MFPQADFRNFIFFTLSYITIQLKSICDHSKKKKKEKKSEKEACIFKLAKNNNKKIYNPTNSFLSALESTRHCYCPIYDEIPRELGKSFAPMLVVECSQR